MRQISRSGSIVLVIASYLDTRFSFEKMYTEVTDSVGMSGSELKDVLKELIRAGYLIGLPGEDYPDGILFMISPSGEDYTLGLWTEFHSDLSRGSSSGQSLEGFTDWSDSGEGLETYSRN